MEIKSFGICCEGSQGHTSRAVVLTKKKKRKKKEEEVREDKNI
jgi:hypothetical protein